MITVFKSSVKLALNTHQHRFEIKYPWTELKIGESFAINDKTQVKLASLRVQASRVGKQLKRKFRAVEHDTCYEVGRIA